MQSLLHATPVQRCACLAGPGQAAQAVGEEEFGVAVGLPEPAQDFQRGLWQGHESVAIAFGVANKHTVAHSVNIPDSQSQTFAQAQAHAVEREVEHLVAQAPGGSKQSLCFFDGDDVGQA